MEIQFIKEGDILFSADTSKEIDIEFLKKEFDEKPVKEYRIIFKEGVTVKQTHDIGELHDEIKTLQIIIQ